MWRRKRSKLSLPLLSPAVANILQVAYYQGLLITRARMLESRGYHVTSVLGNDKAFGLDAAVIAAADLIVIGFSAPLCFAKILCALKIVRFPAATAVPSRLSLRPRAPRFSPGGTPARRTCIC